MRKTSDLDTSPWTQPIPVDGYAGLYLGESSDNLHYRNEFICEAVIISATEGSGRYYVICASSSPGTYTYNTENYWTQTSESTVSELPYSFTYDGKTVYFSTISVGASTPINSMSGNVIRPFAYNQSNAKNAAWTMIYGELEPEGVDIPVQWVSQCGTLETSFEITVS